MTTMRRCFLSCFFLSSYGAAVTAADAELVTRDLFISLDSQPTAFSFTADGPVGSRSGDDAFDSGYGVSAGGRWSFAPAGSSLLAVLAGYVLPGGGGAPASTLVLFIVLGLILGIGYAARPQISERVALGRLLGAATGHGLAVCRPG